MMRKYWTKEEIDFMIENYSNLSLKELKNKFGRSIDGIKEKAYRLNLTKKEFLWTQKEIDFLTKNYFDEKKEILMLNLNHSWVGIKGKAQSIGLKRNLNLLINKDFFKIWTKEMSYIFGFWIADGNMGKNKCTISFSSNDLDLLVMIKAILESDHKICESKRGSFELNFCVETMYNDLLKLGGIPRKSLTIQFPYVPDEFLSDFIRGFLDGDGGFYSERGDYLRSSFTGNIDFLTVLKNKIEENVDIDAKSFYMLDKYNPNRSRRIYRLAYSGKKAILLGDYIYQDSENLRLERKFKIYDKMKKENIKNWNQKND